MSNSKCIGIYYPNGQKEVIRDEIITYDELCDRVGGYLEVHSVGNVQIIADEEGKLKKKDPCLMVDGHVYVGVILVGHFENRGLSGVSVEDIAEFETKTQRYT